MERLTSQGSGADPKNESKMLANANRGGSAASEDDFG